LRSREEILKKVREIEIKSRNLSQNIFSGEYHSVFKGRGMSFKEVREYAAGDDVRFIDWNVSARLGHPYSKIFEEERELTVMMLIDISNSSLFGTTYGRKRDVATEIAAVLAFSAVANGDKVGAIFYSDIIEKFIPPKKGKQQALFIIREMLSLEPAGKGTNLKTSIKYFTNMIKRRSIAFVLSDFIDADYEEALRVAAKKHDIIGIKIYDRMDMELPDAGLMQFEDAETGRLQWIDTGNAEVRKKYQENFFTLASCAANIFKKAGNDLLHVKTGDDYVYVLQRFFKSRM
jgi:uncharacterized protein (DUF58 family)